MIKKAGSIKSPVYNGTHGNLSVAAIDVDLDGVAQDEVIELAELSVGQEIKELKIFNDAIGTGETVQLFVVDRDGKSIKVTDKKDVATKGFIHLDDVNFYVGDNGPMTLYLALSPQTPIHQVVIEIPDKPKGSGTKALSFSVGFSSNNIPVQDVATAYVENLDPPRAKIAIKWTSSDPTIAQVYDDGDIAALKDGHVMITATDTITGVSAKAQFMVGANTIGALVDFDIGLRSAGKKIAAFKQNTNNPSFELENLNPANFVVDKTKIKWSSSNEKILKFAKGSNGVATLVSNGKVSVTAELDGVVKTIKLNVTPIP
ncbi:Ig-like domain-containing protein [Aliivibrio fischeri]|uniref:Ig-like domain-containing protein n=1 Tax=Aliivibrio fischeri TaxID=668 RepID=UPI001F32843E|nr:Ig-like domain-containing protein [Aliivibrio fischeri]MCE7567540.1 Ig-like domain-containing protein [Aliivibrio fischeri]